MKTRRPTRLTYRLLEAALSLEFVAVVAHHVVNDDFRPLAALGAPILLVYYGLSSLLFARGRALAAGPWQVRSLHAAERAMQATLWHMLGIVLGVSAYGLLRFIDVPADSADTSQVALRLVLFAAPYALMQAGLLSFLRAIWLLAPHFTRGVSAFEVTRRVLARN